MWSTFANFKENLSQMASEVMDTVEELEGETPRAEDGDVATSSDSPVYRSQTSKLRRPFDSGRPRKVRDEMNGFVDVELEECRRRCQELEEREKELVNQVRSKEEAFRSLDSSYRDTLHEAENVKLNLDKAQSDLEALNERLREHEARETTASELDQEKLQENAPAVCEEQWLKEVQMRDETISQMRESLSVMEKELNELKAERDSVKDIPVQDEAFSKPEPSSNDSVNMEMLKAQAQQLDILSERLKTAEHTFEVDKAELTLKLEAVTREKDKALSNLSRLKQHLLEKENADSEKMDRDSEQIVLLEAKVAASNARVLQLEQALSQTIASQTESSKRLNEEAEASKSEMQSLISKTNNLYAAIESKDIEISNLQVALGQLYAESDAKERLQRELEAAQKELKKLTKDLQDSKQAIVTHELLAKDAAEKIQLAEKKALDSQVSVQKLQEDMVRLRRALEESMIRLNRMSSDSDYSVDRRIVIKLLVTYFERGLNREVLDLMARMLGFSEDDKRRVGLAQKNAGKPGMVRSVLGLPGRMVGGLLGGSSDPISEATNVNQSFADLWIDFLLKESEERDRKERAEAELNSDHVDVPPSVVYSKPENGFVHDDVFGADFSLPSSASTSALDGPIKGSHRRVYSRP